jgi:hypothetical protein
VTNFSPIPESYRLRWRREGDSNPRSAKRQIAVFETAALDHYAIPPFLPMARTKNKEL